MVLYICDFLEFFAFHFHFLPVTRPGTYAWLSAITWGKPVFLFVWFAQSNCVPVGHCPPGLFLFLTVFSCVFATSPSFHSVLLLFGSLLGPPCFFGHFRDHLLLFGPLSGPFRLRLLFEPLLFCLLLLLLLLLLYIASCLLLLLYYNCSL